MEKRSVRMMRVNVSALALFEGVLGLVVGTGVGVLAWISSASGLNLNTDLVLQGLSLGLAPGVGAVIALAVVYFVAGWVVGLAHGGAFNMLVAWANRMEAASDAAYEDAQSADDVEEPVVEAMPAGRRAQPTFGETIRRRRDR